MNAQRENSLRTLQGLTASSQAAERQWQWQRERERPQSCPSSAPDSSQGNPLAIHNAVDCLPQSRKHALVRLLSSIARTELLEDELLAGLRHGMDLPGETGTIVRAYLASHCADEKRHGEMLVWFLQESGLGTTTSQSRVGRTLRRVVLPLLQPAVRKFPASGLALLLSYEKIALNIYHQIALQARQEGLHELERLIERILRDEARHVSGIMALLDILDDTAVQRSSFWARSLVRLVAWDSRMDDNARHNRGFAQAFEGFGCCRTQFQNHLKQSEAWLLKTFSRSPGSRGYSKRATL